MTELGDKHECLDCGTKFYDLGKTELICPKCGGNQKELAEAEAGKTKTAARSKKAAAKKKKKAKKKAKQEKTPEKVSAVDGDEETATDTDLDDDKMEKRD